MRSQAIGRWLVGLIIPLAVTNLLADYPAGLRAFQNKDYAAALREWQSSGNAGDSQAQNAVGFLYEHGLGVPVNRTEALQWYRKAAEHGYGPAEYNLGLMYRRGDGGSGNPAEAQRWLEKAASQNVGAAQLILGNAAWNNGAGDPQQAFKWWEMAARNGSAAAAYNLAFLYANGRGVPRDDGQALHWYQLAADAGYAPAELALGIMLQSGRGAASDPVSARMWMERARRAGVGNAQSEIQQLDAHLSPEQVHKAVDMAGTQKQTPAVTAPPAGLSGAGAVGFSGGSFVSDPGPLAVSPAVSAPRNSSEVRKVSDPGPEVKWPGAAATGFFVGANGEVLTDARVVRDCKALFVRTDARENGARVITADASSPLAIIRSSITGPPLSILDHESESGEIKGIGYDINGLTAEKITENGGPTKTGGPVVDSQGRVVSFYLSQMAGTSGSETAQNNISQRDIRALLGDHGIGAVESNGNVENPASSVVLVECKP